jgi:hypothetical protein
MHALVNELPLFLKKCQIDGELDVSIVEGVRKMSMSNIAEQALFV